MRKKLKISNEFFARLPTLGTECRADFAINQYLLGFSCWPIYVINGDQNF
jgi:hypothetical protein